MNGGSEKWESFEGRISCKVGGRLKGVMNMIKILYMYENRIMKPVKIVQRGRGCRIRVIEGVNLIKVHIYMY
jgi:hypothetical protein